jgi:hypothetical protein
MDSQTSNRRLCKVKIGKDDLGRAMVTIKIEVPAQDGDYTSLTMESRDIPHPDLVNALATMAEHLLEHAEFPSTWNAEVIGCTVTHTNDVQGLVITGKRDLKNCNAPLIINTPHFTREPYNEDDESDMGLFSGECGQHLDALEEEALAYVDGKRAQLELFGTTKQPELIGASA